MATNWSVHAERSVDAQDERDVADALGCLEDDERTAILAAMLHGLDYRRAAAALSISPETVVALIRRGLHRLERGLPC